MIGFVLSNSGSSTLVSTRITGTGACDSAGFGWDFLEAPQVMQIVSGIDFAVYWPKEIPDIGP